MNLLLGVTGGVAAKLVPKLVQTIVARIPGVELRIIATPRSLYFFDRKAISVPVMTDEYEWPKEIYQKGDPVPHIDLGEWADKMLIAPLTADTLSDMAHGKADKFLTGTVLAWPLAKPLVLAPAMNTRMWENPITQRNLKIDKEIYRARIIGPVAGNLACGTSGIGALAPIDEIVNSLLGD